MLLPSATRKPNPVITAIDAGHFFKTEKSGALLCRECLSDWPCSTIMEARRANAAQYLSLVTAKPQKALSALPGKK